MPEMCNGMKLLDESNKAFSKFNFSWCYIKAGAKKHVNSNNAKRKIIGSEGVSVCFRINRDLYALIRLQANKKSIETNSTVSTNDMIRAALEEAFKLNSQIDIFGDEK